MNGDIYYQALCSHDSRFDGKFFVGVSSTGIYCRPICRVRMPKQENCTFFNTAAEAERAGYRPCLKCRPELAPGNSVLEVGADIARTAASEIEANCGNDESLTELAERLGCTDRHLRRVFEAEYHVSPIQYRQTCRLLLAKKLLTDTDLSVLDVAMASGFGSLRRFNAVFEKEYKLTPSALRKQRTRKDHAADNFIVEIGYRPPYRWEEILGFLAARAIPGVETIIENTYYRTVRIKDTEGWIGVSNSGDRNLLKVTVSESLVKVLPQVLSRVRRLFDTDCDPELIYEGLTGMKEIDANLPIKGIRVPGCFDEFEMSVRAILGQQITVKAATTLAGRAAEEFGVPIDSPIEGLEYVFPSPDEILLRANPQDSLGKLGIIRSRTDAILSLAELFAGGGQLTRDGLLGIRGIGKWTADYILMRTQGQTDVFLPTDYGIRKALEPRAEKEMIKLAEQWRPWCSYAVMNLWNIG